VEPAADKGTDEMMTQAGDAGTAVWPKPETVGCFVSHRFSYGSGIVRGAPDTLWG